MKLTGLFLTVVVSILLLSACGGNGVILPNKVTEPIEVAKPKEITDQKLDHFRLIPPGNVGSGYEYFEFKIVAENRSGETLENYQGDWPEAYPFLMVPGWKSFVPKFTGGLTGKDWVNGIVILKCHFDRGVFSEEVCPVMGYWTLVLQENSPVVSDNSYVPWIIETQGRVYW